MLNLKHIKIIMNPKRLNNMYPSIIETTGRSSRAYDLSTKLLQERIIYIGSVITPELANNVIKQLMWLNHDNPEEPIELYINSPGGSVYDGLAIVDMIKTIQPKVNTLGTGICASMGSYLLACGTGTRRCTENCRVMLHSVSSGSSGSFNDLLVDFKETEFLQNLLLKGYVDFSNGKMTIEQIKEVTQRDCYLNPKEAIEYGIIDSIV